MAPSYPARPCPASRAGSLPVWPTFGHCASEHPGLFRSRDVHDTQRDAHETISGIGEDVRKLGVVTNPANERRAAYWA